MMESPARSLLLGNRVLSYSANVGLNYAHSSRLSFHFATVSAGGQSRRGGQNGIPREEYVLPRSLGMTGGMGMSYAFSPRTQMGLNVEEGRTINRYQHANYHERHRFVWHAKWGSAGSSVSTAAARSLRRHNAPMPAPTSRQIIGGGSIGFRTYTQTLTASYERTSSGAYGFAVGTVTTATGSWNWRRPGSRWSIFASGGQNQIRNAGFVSISGWEASGGISGTLIDRTSLSAQYVYFSSAGTYAGQTEQHRGSQCSGFPGLESAAGFRSANGFDE